MIKQAVVPLLSEIKALKSNVKEKEKKIDDLQIKSDIWMWVAIGSLAAAGVGWLCFVLK